MMFHGEPHNGKTIFLLKLAQYLAENFGEVLYVSSEEFASPTMTKKVSEFLNPLPSRLHFAENLQDPDLSQYQFIILDSVNDLGLKITEYKELRKDHPDKAFYTGKKFAAQYFALNVLPGVAAKAQLIAREDRSAIDIPVDAFA